MKFTCRPSPCIKLEVHLLKLLNSKFPGSLEVRVPDFYCCGLSSTLGIGDLRSWSHVDQKKKKNKHLNSKNILVTEFAPSWIMASISHMSLKSLGKHTQANIWTNLTNIYIHWKNFFFDYRDYWQILTFGDFSYEILNQKKGMIQICKHSLPADLTQSQLMQCQIILIQKMRYLNTEHEYRSVSLTSSNTINR